jgi:hypothetical protein
VLQLPCVQQRTDGFEPRNKQKEEYEPLTIPIARAGLGLGRGLPAGYRHAERRLLPGPVPLIDLVAGTLFLPLIGFSVVSAKRGARGALISGLGRGEKRRAWNVT